jgi:ribosomal protein S12 methylthiotransferase
LKATKLQITRKEIVALFYNIHNVIPSVCIPTNLIAGLPGESQEDVNDLKPFIEEMQFDCVGVFTYSHEGVTRAYALEYFFHKRKRNKG